MNVFMVMFVVICNDVDDALFFCFGLEYFVVPMIYESFISCCLGTHAEVMENSVT